MARILFVVATILLLASVVLTGCMRANEICDYDGLCTEAETDNCIDCSDVLGRGVEQQQAPVDTNAGNYAP